MQETEEPREMHGYYLVRERSTYRDFSFQFNFELSTSTREGHLLKASSANRLLRFYETFLNWTPNPLVLEESMEEMGHIFVVMDHLECSPSRFSKLLTKVCQTIVDRQNQDKKFIEITQQILLGQTQYIEVWDNESSHL